METVLETLRALDDVAELAPEPGSAFPEIAWGDHFFYYSPDGTIPGNTQPFATIVTKDYPGDTSSNLDPEGRWRLNIHVGSARFTQLTGVNPKDFDAQVDPEEFATADRVLPHPVYGSLGWISVVNPAVATTETVLDLLRLAHGEARGRFQRRQE